jgi:hypothetical protein
MNMKYAQLSTWFLLLLTAGCTTPMHLYQYSDKAYAVHAVFLEIPAAQLEELGYPWILDSSKLVSQIESDDIMATLCSARRTRINRFPVVYLNEGEQEKIDEQHPVKYATAYDEHGRPTDYDTRGVGRMIEASLVSVSNGIAQFSCHIEDIGNPSWMTYEIGTPPRKVKQPVFTSRSVSPTSLVLPLNSWLFMGGLIRTMKDGTQLNLIIAIQVKKNGAQQSGPGYPPQGVGSPDP